MSSLWRGLLIQWRVVGAVLIREAYTRFGRENLGFVWIVAEPLIFAVPVLFMWRAIRGSHEHGISVMPFLCSGYLPILLFRHLCGRILLFVRANVPLLYHRRVAIFDIFLARVLLETFSNLTALVVSFTVFYAVGSVDVPRDLPMFYLGYFYMIWWAVASALIIGAVLILDSPHVALAVVVPLVITLWLTTLAFLVRAAARASRGETYTFPRWLCTPVVR